MNDQGSYVENVSNVVDSIAPADDLEPYFRC